MKLKISKNQLKLQKGKVEKISENEGRGAGGSKT